MKKVNLIFAMIVISFSLHAQTEQTYTQMFDSLFSNVPYSTATSGILYDRVANFSSIELFNSQTTDTSFYSRFIQAYSELNRAVTNPSVNQKFSLSTDSLEEKLNNISYIPIGIINARYDIIDTNAFLSGKLYESNGLFYVNNAIGGSLFTQKYAILASPLSKQANLTVRFGLDNLFIFENYTSIVSSVSIDFDDQNGLNNYVIGDTNIYVQYATEGEKNITIQIHLSNGNTIITYAHLEVVSTNHSKPQKALDDYTEVASPPIPAQIPYLGVYGQAIVKYYYKNSDKQLRKPVVIVTGFDPGNKDNFDSALVRLKYKASNGTDKNLVEELYSLGYDIVIVDFDKYKSGGKNIDGGSDYIQRNAYTVIEVINQLNQKLAASGSEHQLVIVGPSMGGQITRYALTYMEKYPSAKTNNGVHNCRLWISFDSPHQGANVSYGAQAFLDFYGIVCGVQDVKNKYNEFLMNPAAKQMLNKHIADPTKSVRNAFYTEIDNLGFPSNLRKIAITNGSLNNTKSGWAGKEVLHLFKTVKLGTWNWGQVDAAKIWLAPEYGNSRDVFFGRYGEFADWWRWLLGIGYFSITSKTYNISSESNSCSADAAPGGTFNTFEIIKKETDKKTDMIDPKYTQLDQKVHCFMPTKSTLAYTGSNKDGCHDISGICLVNANPRQTPFDSYWGPLNKNMAHVTVDADLAKYAINEIETYIEGPRELEACGNVVYSVHLPANTNATITWLCSSNLTIIPSSSPTSVSIYANAAGDGWISAEVSPINGADAPLQRSYRLANYPIKINAPTNSLYLQHLTIPNTTINGSSETWSGIMILPHTFTVEAGKTLTVTSIIHCESNVSITIQPGGKLIVENGGTLTSACDGELWGGIQVLGNPNDLSQNSAFQGKVELKNGAIIENARCAITVGSKPSLFQLGSNSFDLSTMNTFNGGGIVIANGAKFINNQQSIRFTPYYRHTPFGSDWFNLSEFKYCDFTVNDNAYFRVDGANKQVSLYGVKDIKFHSCSFEDLQTKDLQKDFGTAMYVSNNASVNLNYDYDIASTTPSTAPYCNFKNYKTAVWVNGANTNRVSITHTKFQNNGMAIYLNNSYSPSVVSCVITNGGGWQHSHCGIKLENCNLYTIANNHFTGSVGIGLHIKGNTIDNNKIKGNTFDNMCIACYAEGNNGETVNKEYATGLQFLCNQFNGNAEDIRLAAGSSIRHHQGNKSAAGGGAGNCFSGDVQHITDLSGYEYIYHYYTFTDDLCQGATKSRNPNFNPASSIYPMSETRDVCSNRYGYIGEAYHSIFEVTDLEAKYHTVAEAYTILLDNYNGLYGDRELPNWEDYILYPDLYPQVTAYLELTALKEEITDCCKDAIDLLFQNEGGVDKKQYRTWLSRIESVNCDYLTAESYAQDANWIAMSTVLENIDDKYEVNPQQHILFEACMQIKERLSYEGIDEPLLEDDINYLWNAANGNNGYITDWAKSILKSLDGELEEDAPHNPDFPGPIVFEPDNRCNWLTPIMSSQGVSGNNENSNESQNENPLPSIEKKSEITVKPNPTKGELHLRSYELQMKNVEIYDVVGQNIGANLRVRPENNEIIIDVSHLANGMYFLKIQTENGIVMKKFVKQ